MEADGTVPQTEARQLIIAHITNTFVAWHGGFVNFPLDTRNRNENSTFGVVATG